MGKRKRILPLLLAVALMMSGCGAAAQSLPAVDGLDDLGGVQVVSREEGSGTRSAFAELVGFDESTDGERADATAETALVVTDAEVAIDAVASDPSAVGYVSMGALDALDGAKALAVDGVEATLDNVKKGSYPLSRPFCLAWSGSLSELEQDFLTYVLGKGQAIVGQSYVTVADSTSFLSGKQSGTITIHGSTSAAPLLEALAEEYMTLNPNATVEVMASDSTTGLNDAMQGKCDFGAASRELKDYEAELLEYETIAEDGIAVIVNGENPLDAVTLEELYGLFTGTIADWNTINTERED
ncbi:MAG: substrate-binding domain-containing protein [Clostridiales bacterium]|nr:substrate-binding domain-containing protein [Clostridiales bacterium]